MQPPDYSHLQKRLLVVMSRNSRIPNRAMLLLVHLLTLYPVGKPHKYAPSKLVAKVLGCNGTTLRKSELALMKHGLIDIQHVRSSHDRSITILPVPEIPEESLRAQAELKRCALLPPPGDDGEPLPGNVVCVGDPAAVPTKLPTTPPPSEERMVVGPVKGKPAGKRRRCDRPGQESEEVGLTPEQMTWFTQNAANMRVYLRFGKAAYGLTEVHCLQKQLPSMQPDWLSYGRGTPEAQTPAYLLNPFDKRWSVPQFMGWYWDGVCRYREKHNTAITFPSWGRLGREIHNLFQRRAPRDVYGILWAMIEWTELVKYRMGKLGGDLMLDESTVNNHLVISKIDYIVARSVEWQTAEWERYAQGQSPSLGEEVEGG